jgi:hypothetical protein
MQVIVFAISGNLFKSSLHKPSLSVLNDHTLKQLKSVCTDFDVHTHLQHAEHKVISNSENEL